MSKRGYSSQPLRRERIFITGAVQGVGCRPFVYRLASAFSLSGFVYNDTKGVTIEIQGRKKNCIRFLSSLRSETQKPPLLQISTCEVLDIPTIDSEETFEISSSDSAGTALSQASGRFGTFHLS